MIFHWNITNDELGGGISASLIGNDKRFAIHFENDLKESSWTYVEKVGDIEGGILPTEFIDALRQHLEARK